METKLLSEVFSQPWMIEKGYLGSLLTAAYTFHLSGLPIESLKKEPIKPYAVANGAAYNNLGEAPKGSVAIISLNGPVVKNSSESYGVTGTEELANELAKISENPNIIGTVFIMNTGGGSAYAIKPLTDVMDLSSKPIVVHSENLLCSAGVAIAVHASEIMMYHPNGIVGSIGTMTGFQDIRPMLEKWGIKTIEVNSPDSDLKNKDYNDACNGNTEPLSKKLKPLNDAFIADVKAQRKGKINEKHETAFRGETFTGSEAINIGLIDSIGTLQDAINRVNELAGTTSKNQQQSTQATTNSNMKINVKKSWASLASIFGAKFNADQEETEVTATEEQTAEIEQKLASIPGMEAEIQTLKEANATLTTDKATLTQNLATANAEVKRLSALPGAAATATETTGTQENAEEVDETDKILANLEHNKAADKAMGW